MLKYLLYFYIFFLSWTNAFALGKWFPLNVVIGMAAVMLFLLKVSLKPTFSKKAYHSEDIFLLFLMCGILLNSILVPSPKSVNYFLAYFYTFIISYLALKGVFYHTIDYKTLLNVNVIAVCFTALFAVTELSADFLFGIEIQSYFLRTRSPNAYANVFGFWLSRSYGFASEPTILALYFTTLGTLSIWHILRTVKSSVIKHVGIVLIILGFFTTFSSAAIVGLSGSVMLIIIIGAFGRAQYIGIRLFIVMGGILMVILVAFLFPTLFTDESLQQTSFVRKVTELNTSRRYREWIDGLEMIAEHPFIGRGLGSTSSGNTGSNLNWYIFLWKEGGLLCLFPVIGFLLFTFLRILHSKIEGKFWFLVSFLAGVIHLLAISTFYHPFLWTTCLIFNVYNAQWSNLHSSFRSLRFHQAKAHKY